MSSNNTLIVIVVTIAIVIISTINPSISTQSVSVRDPELGAFHGN